MNFNLSLMLAVIMEELDKFDFNNINTKITFVDSLQFLKSFFR